MRVPLSWLKDYVDITISVEELAHRMTLAGLEVSSIDYLGIPSGTAEGVTLAVPISTNHLVWDREKIVVGHILEVKSHPDADRLVLAVVESGIGEVETCVTGAPNLYPYKDQGVLDPPLIAPYAREGAEVIDGHKEDGARMILKPRKLRGIENRTMVCSEKELGLSEEHEGIMLMQTAAAPGTPLQDVLGDAILAIDLTPNMARNFSILGVAREVAALTGQHVKNPSLDIVAEGAAIDGQASIEIVEPELCPRFAAALIKGIEIKPSPFLMQHRLKLIGMRPISNIVDVTNYVMIETGQPLHAFDYDILVERAGGKAPTIIMRRAKSGEKMMTLDGIDRELDEFTEMVTDTKGSLSMAGIMGGAESEVHAGTTSILLEAANWSFINVRQTLGAQRERGKEINSEAGLRFSRGVHPAIAEVGLRRGIEMMREVAGGEIAQGIADNYPLPAPVVTVNLPLSEVERLLGVAMSQDEVVSILTGLEFSVVRKDANVLKVIVPNHRMDIGYLNDPSEADIAEVIAQADLIEEIARIYGYDRIPDTMLEDEVPPQRNNTPLQHEERVRDILVRAGLQEIINYRITTPEREALLTPPDAKSDWPDAPYVTLANPVSQDRRVMRHTLLASTLEILAANARWRTRQTLFEIGKVYLPVAGEKLPAEPRHLCIAMTGERALLDWQDDPGKEPELLDFYDLKGVVEALLSGLHLDDVHYEKAEHSTFYPGRTALLKACDTEIGTMGELHPLVAQAFDLPDRPVLIAEFDLEALLSCITGDHQITAIFTYPAIYQDIAIIVDQTTPAVEVENTIRETGGFLLRDVHLFDVFTGEQIGAGKKSLAYALTFQAPDKTLRDKDADKMRNRIVHTLEQKLGAKLRA